MNIKKIIQEEISTSLDSFYLIVSDDEKFIYGITKDNGIGHINGFQFQPVENFSSFNIIKSSIKDYDVAQDKLDEFTHFMRNEYRENDEYYTDYNKYNPKIISVDFLIKKREESFPILESDDLDWMREIPASISFEEIKKHTNDDKVVMIWYDGMTREESDYILNNIDDYGFKPVKDKQRGLIYNLNVKGLTFYRNGDMGYFTNREDWDGYIGDSSRRDLHIIDRINQ